MAEEIGFENGRNSNFQGLVTLTLDPAIRHTIVHNSSTSTYIPNFIQIEETFCGRTDVRTYWRTDIFPPILLGWLLEVDLKTRPGLVALYDIRPGNGVGPFLQPRSPHGASDDEKHCSNHLNATTVCSETLSLVDTRSKSRFSKRQ